MNGKLWLNIDKCKAVSYCLKTPLDAQYHIMDGNTLYKLEKLNFVNDVGVIFDSNVTFKDHMAQKINKAYSILAHYWVLLKEILYTRMSLVSYYYINQWSDHMWNTQIPCGVLIYRVISKSLKNFFKRATKLDLSWSTYTGRLRGDMIEIFKIMHNIYDAEVSLNLRHYPKSNTRGNK